MRATIGAVIFGFLLKSDYPLICVIMGLRNASPVGRGGGEADGEGSTVRKEPSHPLSRELSQRESLWLRSCILRGMGFALCLCKTKAKPAIKHNDK